jgi:sortase A
MKKIIIVGLAIVFIVAITIIVATPKHKIIPGEPEPSFITNEEPEDIASGSLNNNNTQNLLIIPKIGVKIPIVEGKDESVLNKGAWRMPETSTPDKGSNTVITGHRWLFRPPSEKTFYLLDKLVIGDTFKIFWEGVEYNYQVASSIIVLPTDLYVLEPTSNSVVTLITCHPLFSTKKRLVVQGELYETLNK